MRVRPSSIFSATVPSPCSACLTRSPTPNATSVPPRRADTSRPGRSLCPVRLRHESAAFSERARSSLRRLSIALASSVASSAAAAAGAAADKPAASLLAMLIAADARSLNLATENSDDAAERLRSAPSAAADDDDASDAWLRVRISAARSAIPSRASPASPTSPT